MKLNDNLLKTDEQLALESMYKELSNAEILTWIIELSDYLNKRLESLKDNCSDTVNEGSDEEERVLNPLKYQTEKMKINGKAIQLLYNNFTYERDETENLFEIYGIDVSYPYTETGVKTQLKYFIPLCKAQLEGKDVKILECVFHDLTLTTGNSIEGLKVFCFDGRAKVSIEGDGDIAVIEETYQISGSYTIISDSVCIIDTVRLR